MEVWRWNLENSHKEQLGEAFLAGQVVVSQDGTATAWSEVTRKEGGGWASELHWQRGEDERIIASDTAGHNLDPSLSADGNTLVWMMQYQGQAKPNEIRRVVLD